MKVVPSAVIATLTHLSSIIFLATYSFVFFGIIVKLELPMAGWLDGCWFLTRVNAQDSPLVTCFLSYVGETMLLQIVMMMMMMSLPAG